MVSADVAADCPEPVSAASPLRTVRVEAPLTPEPAVDAPTSMRGAPFADVAPAPDRAAACVSFGIATAADVPAPVRAPVIERSNSTLASCPCAISAPYV